MRFFLDEYRPTPIVSPWNGRYKMAVKVGDKRGMDIIRASENERLQDYRLVIEETKSLLGVDDKASLLAECLSELPDFVLPWLDAVYVLTADAPRYLPLLSAGGTVGTNASGVLP